MGRTRVPRQRISDLSPGSKSSIKTNALQHMRSLAGPGARIHFTHLSASSSKALASVFSDSGDEAALAKGQAYQIDILQFMKDNGISMSMVCLLDPKAEQELSSEDGNGSFTHFLFGVRSYLCSVLILFLCFAQGILGTVDHEGSPTVHDS